MLPDLESLRCVDALARTLRFHQAARSCALSPAAFGRRVRDVEEWLGASLFFRTTRRVELTEDGARFLPRIRTLLHEAMALRTGGAAAVDVDVTVGTRYELGMSWLLPARTTLRRANPTCTCICALGGRRRSSRRCWRCGRTRV